MSQADDQVMIIVYHRLKGVAIITWSTNEDNRASISSIYRTTLKLKMMMAPITISVNQTRDSKVVEAIRQPGL